MMPTITPFPVSPLQLGAVPVRSVDAPVAGTLTFRRAGIGRASSISVTASRSESAPTDAIGTSAVRIGPSCECRIAPSARSAASVDPRSAISSMRIRTESLPPAVAFSRPCAVCTRS